MEQFPEIRWVSSPLVRGVVKGPGLVLLVTADSEDNFWHNGLLACIGSTDGGSEWLYLADLLVNLSSHLALFLLLALWTPCDCVAESPS